MFVHKKICKEVKKEHCWFGLSELYVHTLLLVRQIRSLQCFCRTNKIVEEMPSLLEEILRRKE